MITAAHWLHKSQHDFATMGFNLKTPVEVDFPKLLSWKNSVSQKMSNGVSQLLKGNNVTIIRGEAQFKSATEITVNAAKTEAELGHRVRQVLKRFRVNILLLRLDLAQLRFRVLSLMRKIFCLQLGPWT